MVGEYLANTLSKSKLKKYAMGIWYVPSSSSFAAVCQQLTRLWPKTPYISMHHNYWWITERNLTVWIVAATTVTDATTFTAAISAAENLVAANSAAKKFEYSNIFAGKWWTKVGGRGTKYTTYTDLFTWSSLPSIKWKNRNTIVVQNKTCKIS